jgi:hypothetical protein
MFPPEYFDHVYQELIEHGVSFDPGLTSGETSEIEERNGVKFPPDLAAFLQHGVPRLWRYDVWGYGEQVTTSFPDWRGNPNVISEGKARLLEGLLFDVDFNNRWIPQWGERPLAIEDSVVLVKELLDEAPIMLPIYSHRFIPSEPLLAGNPVFSIVEMDIIHYGTDLADYLAHEFGVTRPDWSTKQPRLIRYWQDIWRFNNTPNPGFERSTNKI